MKATKRVYNCETSIFFESDGWFERLLMEYLCQNNLTASFSTAQNDDRMKVVLSKNEHVDRCLSYMNDNNPLVHEYLEDKKKRNKAAAFRFLKTYNEARLQ